MITKLIGLLWEAARLNYPEAKSYVVQKVGTMIKAYFRALAILIFLAIVPPYVLIGLGIAYDNNWFIFLGGIGRIIFLLPLLLAAKPIVILIELFLGMSAGSGERYLKFFIGFLIMALVSSLAIMIIPVRNNLNMLPALWIVFIILGFFVFQINRKVIAIVFGLIALGVIACFFLPNTFRTVAEKMQHADKEIGTPQCVQFSFQDLKAGRVHFFDRDGKPNIWFLEVNQKYKFFDRPGCDPTLGMQLEPITKEVAQKLMDNPDLLSENNITGGVSDARPAYANYPSLPTSDPIMQAPPAPAMPAPPMPSFFPGTHGYRISWATESHSTVITVTDDKLVINEIPLPNGDKLAFEQLSANGLTFRGTWRHYRFNEHDSISNAFEMTFNPADGSFTGTMYPDAFNFKGTVVS